MKYTDPDGRVAGDLFDTMDEAAKDFAITYNDDSIKNNVELATYIRYKAGKYYYDIPQAGNESEATTSRLANDKTIVAQIHTHGAYMEKTTYKGCDMYTRALEPSIGDIQNVKKSKLPLYTVTPDGGFFLTTYDGDELVTYSYTPKAPSDPNCQFRKNTNNAYDYPDNTYVKK